MTFPSPVVETTRRHVPVLLLMNQGNSESRLVLWCKAALTEHVILADIIFTSQRGVITLSAEGSNTVSIVKSLGYIT